MTKGAVRPAAAALCLMLLVAPLAACDDARVPLSDDGMLDVGGGDPAARRPAACATDRLTPVCDDMERLGQVRFLDMMPSAEPDGAPQIRVLPDGRVRYELRLRIRGHANASIVTQFGSVFEKWRTVEERPDLLVYRDNEDAVEYEAALELRKVGSGRRLEYLVDASISTVSSVAGRS